MHKVLRVIGAAVFAMGLAVGLYSFFETTPFASILGLIGVSIIFYSYWLEDRN